MTGSLISVTMAARRIAKSSVDWHSLATKIPARQKDAFRVIKTSTDKYVARLQELPEALPKIDFSDYKNRIANTAFVEEFEKMYESVAIPFPKDTANNADALKAAEKREVQATETFKVEGQARCKELNVVITAMDSVPPPEKMTRQMFNYYFPEAQINPNRDNPGFFPQHEPSLQYENMEVYYNTRNDRRNLLIESEAELLVKWQHEEKLAEREKQLAEDKSKEAQKKLN